MKKKRNCVRCFKDKEEDEFSLGMKVCKTCRAKLQKKDRAKKMGTFDLYNMFVGTPRY